MSRRRSTLQLTDLGWGLVVNVMFAAALIGGWYLRPLLIWTCGQL